MMRKTLCVLLVLFGTLYEATSFSTSFRPYMTSSTRLFAGNDDQETRLKELGFSERELEARSKPSDSEPVKVRVDLVEDVDPVTLTAIGFALIAANFLIFANMGDGGIAGIVARIINLSNQ